MATRTHNFQGGSTELNEFYLVHSLSSTIHAKIHVHHVVMILNFQGIYLLHTYMYMYTLQEHMSAHAVTTKYCGPYREFSFYSLFTQECTTQCSCIVLYGVH